MKTEDRVNLFKGNILLMDFKKATSDHAYHKELVGGAIFDLLDGREPKDYDFLVSDRDKVAALLEDNGYKFIRETKTAITLTKEINFKTYEVQLLKRNKTHEFPFRVQLSVYSVTKEVLAVHRDYDRKVLIPMQLDSKPCDFDEKGKETYLKSLASCIRITPKYLNKGFYMSDPIWNFLVTSVSKTNGRINS